MTGNEVGDDLLFQSFLAVDAVKLSLEFIELLERRLAHQSQHMVAGVLRSDLQSTADMAGNEFACVFLCCPVCVFILTLVEQQVVADTTANKALLDFRQRIDGPIDVQQLGVVGVEVGTYLRVNATWALALLADGEVAAMHAIHVGRRSAEV